MATEEGMMGTISNKQRGVSISGFLVMVVALVLVVIACVKVIPPYLDDYTIKKFLNTVARDPDMKNATVRDIRQSFSRHATVSNITAISPDDIEVTKDADGITLSAHYSVKIPLVGNATLVLEFNPSSSAK
jgi:hypothetical protein